MEYIVRNENIDGVEHWLWPKEDTGLWNGPKTDWQNHHKPNIQKYVKKFNVVVQAGGGCGMYPRLLSKMFDLVYTWEPTATSFHCLVNNCESEKVIKLNAAVGSVSSFITIKPGSKTNHGTNRVERLTDSYIPLIPVDSLHLKACDLIMFDLEGYEGEAIKGAMETIDKFGPVIFAERGKDCDPMLIQMGYTYMENSVSDAIYTRK